MLVNKGSLACHKAFEKVTIDEGVPVCFMSMCVCPLQAILRKLLSHHHQIGTVTASGTIMHKVLIIIIDLDLPSFKVSHTHLNHENNKGSIISTTFRAMTIKCAVKIVRLKVYTVIFSSPII